MSCENDTDNRPPTRPSTSAHPSTSARPRPPAHPAPSVSASVGTGCLSGQTGTDQSLDPLQIVECGTELRQIAALLLRVQQALQGPDLITRLVQLQLELHHPLAAQLPVKRANTLHGLARRRDGRLPWFKIPVGIVSETDLVHKPVCSNTCVCTVPTRHCWRSPLPPAVCDAHPHLLELCFAASRGPTHADVPLGTAQQQSPTSPAREPAAAATGLPKRQCAPWRHLRSMSRREGREQGRGRGRSK